MIGADSKPAGCADRNAEFTSRAKTPGSQLWAKMQALGAKAGQKSVDISKNYSLKISTPPPHFSQTAVTRFGVLFHFSFDFHQASSDSFFLHMW